MRREAPMAPTMKIYLMVCGVLLSFKYFSLDMAGNNRVLPVAHPLVTDECNEICTGVLWETFFLYQNLIISKRFFPETSVPLYQTARRCITSDSAV